MPIEKGRRGVGFDPIRYNAANFEKKHLQLVVRFNSISAIMSTIGERLSEARKNFGIDLRSAAEATKIRSDFLAALEENKPDRISLADVYKVGFLRIYAKYLKLDADRLVAEFRTALSFQGTPARGSRLAASINAEGSSVAEASGIDSGSVFAENLGEKGALTEKLLSGGGIRWILTACVVLAVLGLGAFVITSVLSENSESNAVSESVQIPTPDTQQYEFQVISKIPQNVTITDCYGATAAESATLLDNVLLPANRPQIFKGRGVLLIKDSGGKNLEIRFPKLSALKASQNALVPVKFEESDREGLPFTNDAAYWTANPFLETR